MINKPYGRFLNQPHIGVDGGGIIGFLLLLVLYFLPTIVGSRRKVVNIGSIFVVNILLGGTVIGWIVALAMAARTNPNTYDKKTP